MHKSKTSKSADVLLRLSAIVMLALSVVICFGCSAQADSSEDADSSSGTSSEERVENVLEEDPAAKSGILANDEVNRASIVTGEGIGGTASASSEQVAFAQSIAIQLEVPIREDISFSMGPLMEDDKQGDVPLRAILFYEGPYVCASASCTEDGSLYGDSASYMDMSSVASMARS